jgi:pyrroloquinoline quinone (PQQ) biosynthesis protein C
MEIKQAGTVSLKELFNSGADFKVSLESEGTVNVVGWRSTKNDLSHLEYLKKCHETLGIMINKLESGDLSEPKNRFHFWRKDAKTE